MQNGRIFKAGNSSNGRLDSSDAINGLNTVLKSCDTIDLKDQLSKMAIKVNGRKPKPVNNTFTNSPSGQKSMDFKIHSQLLATPLS